MPICPVNNLYPPKVLSQDQQKQIAFKGLNVQNAVTKVVRSKGFRELHTTIEKHPLPFEMLLNTIIFGSIGFAISKIVNHKKKA